ncbi:MAG: protein translocase subunit SecD [Planctomycetaceae bacterium]|nr:protein translocase subunit SecD [Planctomycetaceae bacterium]
MEATLVTYVLYGVFIASLAATAVLGMIGRPLGWRSTLIIAVISLFCAELYPPAEQLRPGIDLDGGASLLYEVDLEGVQNKAAAMREVLEILRKRVDPGGTLNLEWRVESGNRIEIRMPTPDKAAQERRAKFDDAFKEITDRNLRRFAVVQAIEAGSPLEGFERGVTGRGALLAAAQGAYDELGQLPEDTSLEDTRRIDAEDRYDAALEALFATNIDEAVLNRALGLSTDKKKDDLTSPREMELARIKMAHPDRSAEIDALVVVYDEYSANRGTLDDVNDLKRLLRGSGVLAFRMAVTTDDVNPAELGRLRDVLAASGPVGSDEFKWYPVNNTEAWIEDARDRTKFREKPLEFFEENRGVLAGEYGGQYYLLLWDREDKTLTRSKPRWELTRVFQSVDQNTGYPALAFNMNPRGASYLGALTGKHVGEQMAIVLDDEVYSAPVLNDRISDSGIITGGRAGFSSEELTYLKRTLQAGRLKAGLSEEPISERTISPSLGARELNSGMNAALYALIAVAVFMMLYYLFAGAVANMALLANIVIVLGVMATLDATFTLPGIAGIVLTIGMCVDANVLIFERIREERERGADMSTALRLGYGKALSAIIDGNVTNLIVCVILAYTASPEVVGFAKVFGFGICATLFSSLFMTRVIFTLWSRAVGLKQLSMVPTLIPAVRGLLSPNVKWVNLRGGFFVLSFIAIVGGIVLTAQRGVDMLDIQFRAGTEVEVEAEVQMPVADARSRIDSVPTWLAEGFDETTLSDGQRDGLARLRKEMESAGVTVEDLAVLADASVVGVGEKNEDLTYSAFSVVSTVEQQKVAAAAVRAAFGDVIKAQSSLGFEHDDVAGVMDQDSLPPNVHGIDKTWLGDVIGRPGLRLDVSDRMGGVAIVIDQISPAVTVEDVEERIKAMRRMPDYARHPYVAVEVIGLGMAAGSASSEEPTYTSLAVVGKHRSYHYIDDASVWGAEFAAVEWNLLRDALTRPTSLDKVSNYTPTVARSIQQKAIVALVLSCFAIVAYIWFRFGSLRYGLAAIAALLHDVVIVIGLVAVSGLIYRAMGDQSPLLIEPFRINMNVIAALLTIIGYSLNDTIVVFDRIREVRGKLAHVSPEIINTGINQCISRTLLTSFTTFLAVGVMYTWGGSGIRDFAFAVLCGVVVGTYSSIAIAAPILLIGTKRTVTTQRERGAADGEPATA